MIVRRALAVLLAIVPVLVGGVLVAEPASARTLGGVAWSPAKGGSETLISVTTEHGCDPGAKRVSAVLFGEGLPKDGQVVVAPSTLLMSTSQPMTLPLSNAFVVYAERNSTPLVGTYTLKVRCTDRFGVSSLGDFVTTMTWKTPGGKLANVEKATYVAKNTADVKPVALPDDSGLGALPQPSAPAPSTAASPNASDPQASTPPGGVTASPRATGSASSAPSLSLPAGTDAASTDTPTSDGARPWWLALTVLSGLVLVGAGWWLVRQRRTSA